MLYELLLILIGFMIPHLGICLLSFPVSLDSDPPHAVSGRAAKRSSGVHNTDAAIEVAAGGRHSSCNRRQSPKASAESRGAWRGEGRGGGVAQEKVLTRPLQELQEPAGLRFQPETSWQWGESRTESKPRAFTTSRARLPVQRLSEAQQTSPRPYMRGAANVRRDTVPSSRVPRLSCAARNVLLQFSFFLLWEGARPPREL